LGALSTTTTSSASTTASSSTSSGSKIQIKKEDVDFIVGEMECTEDEAMAALRAEVGVDTKLAGEKLVEAALRRLITM
jgi:NACalpha-BTF3-like transcription factor